MSVSALFIRRPVMTTLMVLAILMTGIQGYRALPVSDLPNVDFPAISVSAQLPGASPETMASSIATPLEREFSTIAGIDSMTSTSALGSTSITITFVLSRNIDAAAQDVQSAIARAAKRLPLNMPSPPSFRKVNPADQPVLYLAAIREMVDLVGEILRAGGDANAVLSRDRCRRTAHAVAYRSRFPDSDQGRLMEIMRLLVGHGADLGALDERGQTVLQNARVPCECGKAHVNAAFVEMLRGMGCT